VIETVDQQPPPLKVEVEVISDWSLAAVAYAAFFTESERDEIGTFDELPAPERARWESVAAHIARTVVSPIDADLAASRAEQRTELAEQVRDAPYSRDLWRAMTRTTDMQQRIAAPRDLLIASKASIAMVHSHSRRLATSAQALDRPIWWDDPTAGEHDDQGHDPATQRPRVRTGLVGHLSDGRVPVTMGQIIAPTASSGEPGVAVQSMVDAGRRACPAGR